MDDLLPIDEDLARFGGFFDNGLLSGVQAGTNARFNFGGGSTPPAQNTPLPVESAPAADAPAAGGGAGAGNMSGLDFLNSAGGANLIGGSVQGLFGLLQNGILFEQAKRNPAAADLANRTRELEAQRAAGGDPAQINAQLGLLAQQNAALIQQMQQPKSALSNPVVVVTGMLLVLGAGAALLIGLSRGGGGRRDQDPNIIDLPPGSWSY